MCADCVLRLYGLTNSEYNFQPVQQIYKINIVDDVAVLFKEINEMITNQSQSTIQKNYYFVIIYTGSATTTTTKPIKYVFTTMIDLGKYKDIQWIYAVSQDSSSITINCMKLDNAILSNIKTAHNDKYITPNPTP